MTDRLDDIIQEVIDSDPLTSPRFMSMLSLKDKEREARVRELRNRILNIKVKARAKINEHIKCVLAKYEKYLMELRQGGISNPVQEMSKGVTFIPRFSKEVLENENQ